MTEIKESTNLRMYRKALAKEQAIDSKRQAAEEKVAPRVAILQGRIDRVRRRVITLEAKYRDATTQRMIRFRKLNGGEVGKISIEAKIKH